MGDLKVSPAELARIRHQEAEASAALIGARAAWPGITDESGVPE